MAIVRGLVVALAFVSCTAVPGAAQAQDALRGKRLYHDVGRITGAGVSCVDCHLGLPPGLFGIGRAANTPSIIEQAIASVPLMAPLRGRLSPADVADLAAYIGDPGVASPDARVTTAGPAAIADDPGRLDFGIVAIGAVSAASTIRLTNLGAVPFTLTGAPRLAGNHPADFSIVSTDCSAALVLAAQQSCSTTVVLQPSAAGPRQASLQIAHDWIGGQAALALLGNQGSAAAPPMGSTNAGGGGSVHAFWLVLLALLVQVLPLRGASGRIRRR